MINWFTTLSPEQQVGLLTIVLTIVGGVLVKGRGPKEPFQEKHKDDTPVLSQITCAYTATDHERMERLEQNLRVIRDTQIEILTLVRNRS